MEEPGPIHLYDLFQSYNECEIVNLFIFALRRKCLVLFLNLECARMKRLSLSVSCGAMVHGSHEAVRHLVIGKYQPLETGIFSLDIVTNCP